MRSAALRIAGAYAIAFTVATALLGLAVYLVAHRAIAGQFDERISAEMSSLRNEYRGEGQVGLLAVIHAREEAQVTRDMDYGLYAADGRRIAGAMDAPRPPLGWQILVFRDPAEGVDTARALAVDITPQRRLVVAADWDTLHDLDMLILTLLGATLLAMAVMGSVGALLLAGYLRRRLAVIAGGAEKIIGGDLVQRIPVGSRQDEFDRLALVLNAMLDRIVGLLDTLRQVSGDLAHDLRSPLSRLRNLLERGLADPQPEAILERAIEQTDQVLALFGSILRLSEIEAGELRHGFQSIALDGIATEIGESFAPAFEDGGRSLRLRINAVPAVEGDRELLAQALVNLLENAQVHTPPGAIVQLTTEALPDRIRVIVADDGPGVADADRDRIVGRFARLDASRHRPGHGLGLSLVAAIARIHGATLRFDDNSPGLVATLEFPS